LAVAIETLLSFCGREFTKQSSAYQAMRCPTSNFGIKLSLARLLDSAANLRKHIVGIRPDESDRAHDDDQNHCQHHRVFRDVLTTLIRPELL
jgi:hypothetical protein